MALVVAVVRHPAALGRQGADEVDVRVAGALEAVPEQGAPAAGGSGDRVAQRHDPDGAALAVAVVANSTAAASATIAASTEPILRMVCSPVVSLRRS